MTTLLVSSPRVRSNRLRSDDQLKSKIRPEVNFVNCFGFRPERGCSQMLVVPLSVTRYCKSVPVGDHRTREVPPGTLNIFAGGPPFTEQTAIFHTGGYSSKGYESSIPSGEISSGPVMPSPTPAAISTGEPPSTDIRQIFCGRWPLT